MTINEEVNLLKNFLKRLYKFFQRELESFDPYTNRYHPSRWVNQLSVGKYGFCYGVSFINVNHSQLLYYNVGSFLGIVQQHHYIMYVTYLPKVFPSYRVSNYLNWHMKSRTFYHFKVLHTDGPPTPLDEIFDCGFPYVKKHIDRYLKLFVRTTKQCVPNFYDYFDEMLLKIL